ncbi:hypothetical protein CEXT_373271 [Caerostris extrusa]|uniref:Uncharacterized protein n=1 Tax=Caerostris extrusa TaxID=172846 RepID=A0AAV4UBN0_CAEEX|nr:hypothetical protein CEXT_373271 [Caerostris extrusa]
MQEFEKITLAMCTAVTAFELRRNGADKGCVCISLATLVALLDIFRIRTQMHPYQPLKVQQEYYVRVFCSESRWHEVMFLNLKSISLEGACQPCVGLDFFVLQLWHLPYFLTHRVHFVCLV